MRGSRAIGARFVASLLSVVPALALVPPPSGSQSPAAPPSAAEQDHQRLLNLLHITSLRRGADGNPGSPNAANRDESKAGPFSPLPDPLVLKNGKRVKNAKTWWTQRRPEIVEDFEREIYGRVPKNVPTVRWGVISAQRESVGDVPVVTRNLVGYVDNSAYPALTVGIQLSVTTPAGAKDRVPVIMEFGFSPEMLVTFARRAEQSGQPNTFAAATLAWHQQVLAKRWGYATLVPVSVQADNGAGLTEGIIGLVNKGQPRKLDDWGALRAWAWGASRALDYFETDSAVDAKRVAIEGLSRYGKAALVTMAFDQRFAIGFIGSSGAGGAKLWRRDFGEKLENVAATGEYHWMAGNFLKYAGPLTPNDLQVDQHELIALCAPRPIFVSAGSVTQGDSWVDPQGSFLAEVAAGPVYRLLGQKDLGTSKFPAIETALVSGDLAFRQHSAGHTVALNWPALLAFAERYFSSR